MTAYHTIELQRNAHYTRQWALTDPSTGDPLDLTGAVFDMDVRYAEGVAPVLAEFAVSVDDETGGLITVSLAGSALDAVPGAQERVELAYDLLATQGGISMPLAHGPLVLTPGVSDAT